MSFLLQCKNNLPLNFYLFDKYLSESSVQNPTAIITRFNCFVKKIYVHNLCTFPKNIRKEREEKQYTADIERR